MSHAGDVFPGAAALGDVPIVRIGSVYSSALTCDIDGAPAKRGMGPGGNVSICSTVSG